ncbi:D-alanyl-D-alanine carboxypeptidase family protein [Enhydrobacter aerosaccus]|uniref:D-alanyl-D-alanine carboxypeptidase family protein n=1 Tax=Enhydrobacter aerosaccus TaxID=225324 RepID=UPI001E5C6590|nr:D-alanyl-D-alanine carboxypeptidase family protein [Enhydrobacter aerosaccus]
MSWPINRSFWLLALLALAGFAGAAHTVGAQQQTPNRHQTQKPAPAKPATPNTKPLGPKQAAAAQAAKLEAAGPSQIGPTTIARFAYMIDAQTGAVLLAKDADKPMAPSSMAKMMTVYLLFEDLAAGKLKPDTLFKVSDRAYAITRGVHSSTMFLELGAEASIADLVQGIIVVSGNDASVAVAEGMAGSEESFAERMNKKARELGLTGSVFKNSSGWPAEGQHVTAHDLAVLAARTIKDFPQYYHYYAQREFTYNGKTQANRNLELKSVPGVDGLKTGHTEEGGFGQTTSAIRDGRRLVLVLNGLTSMADRAQETARLIEWGFRESSNTTILRAGDMLAEAPVWLGALDKVPLVIPTAVQMTTTVGQTAQPRVVAKFDGPVPAPIAKGTKLGTAAITFPDGRTVEYPLEAGTDVPKLGIVGRIAAAAKHYLFGWLS